MDGGVRIAISTQSIMGFRRFLETEGNELRWSLLTGDLGIESLQPGTDGVSGRKVSERLNEINEGGNLFAAVKESFAGLAKILLAIRPGDSRSYREVATAMGCHRTAARAIGRQIGTNSLCGLIPCHRVVRADGGIGGYRWGTELKVALLRAEEFLDA